MRNKTLLRVVQVLGFFTTVAVLPAAHAVQQITLSLPDCPNGQTMSFNNNTLSCSGQVVLLDTPNNCSITGNGTTQANPNPVSTLVALTANCAGGLTPVNYTWTIPGFGSVGPQATLNTSPTATTTYTVSTSNSAGNGQTFSTTVYVGSPPASGGVSPPSGCVITQSPNTNQTAVLAGTSVNLSVTCNSNAPTGCNWGGGISSQACSVTVSAPAVNTTYSVSPFNTAGNGNSISSTVNVASGGGIQGTNYCTGSDTIINVAWPTSGQVRPSTNGFGNQRIAYKITVPATFAPALNVNHLGFARVAEVPGSPVTARDVTVSLNPCDFQSGNYLYDGIGYGDTGPGANFTVNNPTGYFAVGANFNVQSGTTFYVNIRNANNGIPSCPTSSCNILFDFATPNRY